MTTTTAEPEAQQRLHTIGAVCRRLQGEFPDISISKIRYLEDQGLLQPKRTQGGYRLFSEHDVERLHRILELQRDEFLPLRVIREELAAGAAAARRRRARSLAEDDAGIDARHAKELEDFGLLAPHGTGSDKRYPESDADVAATCAQLARFGIDPRHLRTFRSAADREAGLIEAIVGPALRSRSAERRRGAADDLELLGAQAQELIQLLFLRALRRLAST